MSLAPWAGWLLDMGVEASAETAYLFRHALLRDAAYELQPPGERSRLHRIAASCIEHVYSGPPEAPPLSAIEIFDTPPHPLDAHAADILFHAEASLGGGEADPALIETCLLYLQRAACHSDRMHRSVDAAALWRRAGELATGQQQLSCLLRSAASTHRNGDARHADKQLREVLSAARAGPDRRFVAIVLAKLMNVARELGETKECETLGLEARAIARECGDPLQEAVALGSLAMLYRETGRVAESEAAYLQSLEVFREAAAPRYAAVALSSLAVLYQMTGRGHDAMERYQEALKLCRDVGDRRLEGMTIGNIGIVYQGQQRYAEAAQHYEEALAIHREVGNRRSEGITLGNIAGMVRETGDPQRAAGMYEAALAIHRELGNRAFEGGHLGYYAICLLELGRVEDARQAWSSASSLLAKHGDTVQLKRGYARIQEACTSAGITPFKAPAETEAGEPAGS
mgnify:CR=1 FL=1